MQRRYGFMQGPTLIVCVLLCLAVIGCEIEETDLPARGVISVSAVDTTTGDSIEGASIFINDQLQTLRTPAVISNKIEGQYTVSVRPGQGYVTVTQTVELVPPDTAFAVLQFNEPDTSVFNNQSVFVESDAENAIVIVDDQLSEYTTPAEFLLTPGEYFISCYAPGMKTVSPSGYALDAVAADSATLSFTLEEVETGNTVGTLAPEFELNSFTGTDFSGGPFSPAQYRGRVLLVNFWHSECAPCRAEFPGLEQVYQDHQDAGFRILAVNAGYNNDNIPEFQDVKDIGLTFPMLYNGDNWQHIIQELYSIMDFPTNFLVDEEGIIQYRVGAVEYEELSTMVEGLLSE